MRRWICALICICILLLLPVCGFAEETNDGTTPTTQETPDPPTPSENTSHECSFGSWTPSGDGHVGTCSCGERKTENHAFADAGVITAATCTQDGEKSLACKCGATQTAAITATGHSYVYTPAEANHQVTCRNCDLNTTEEHTNNTTTTQSTCVTQGKTVTTCSKCAYATEQILPLATTHAFGEWGGDSENHSRTCRDCTESQSGPHTWGTETVVTAATCKDAGVKSSACTVCAKVKQVEIPKKTTHTYDNDCDDTCNVCQEKRTADHEFSDEFTKDGTGHWFACLYCGAKEEHLKHVPGPAATEYREQTCLACGYVLTARLNHVHNLQDGWKSDKQGHWHTCTSCNLELDFSKHAYGTGCEGCKECGYVDPDMHIYDGVWELDRLSHWGTCTVCGKVSEQENHIPGPEATADNPQTCAVCGYVMAEYVAHEHVSTGEWFHNDADHWNECDCGEKLDVDPHIWDKGTKNKDKTITYTCAMCHAEKIQEQPSNGGGFPWGALLVILIILLAAAFGTLAWILLQPKQSGKFTNQP